MLTSIWWRKTRVQCKNLIKILVRKNQMDTTWWGEKRVQCIQSKIV